MSDLSSLIAAIDQDPDDDARYLVLADALIAAGDPRGELITLQAELAKRPHDRALLTAESVALRSSWGDLEPYRRFFRDARWRLGFLDELDIDHHAPPEVVAALTSSPVTRWLRSLSWAGNLKIAAGDLTPLANLRRLVPGTTLSDPELHDFAALPRVDQLHLFGRLSAGAIASVRLRALGLAFMYDFTDAHVAATARIASLRELRLQSSAFSDAALEQLGDGLRSLTLIRASTNSVFQHLARHRLTTLEISPEARLDAAGLARLEHPTLEQLFLDQVANAEAALAALAEHRSLESAYLAGVDYQPVKAETLGRVLALPSLRRLRLSIQGSIEGDVLTDTKLTALELRSSRVSPAFAAFLAQLPLVELHLPQHGTDEWVDDTYLAQLAANPALERLDLPNAIITDRGLRALHGHPRLASLSLNYCRRFTSRGIAELVGELPALRKLVLHGIDLGTDALAAIARTDIRSLRIHHGNIDDSRLAALLPAASTLRELHVAHCPLTLAAVPVLVQFHALDRLSIGYSNHAEEYADEELASASVLRPLMPHCFMEI